MIKALVFIICLWLLIAALGFGLFLVLTAGFYFSLRGLLRLARGPVRAPNRR